MSEDLQTKLRQIEELRRQIGAYGTLPQSALRRIEYRFRLECNYTSNRMEGGALTRQETRSVMIGNISVDNKPFRDIAEMKGHDEVLTQILRIGKGELNLSERRIKDIHKTIVFEEDPAQQDALGQWKSAPNHIINARLERYDFLPPDEVPEAMHRLLNALNAGLEKIKRHDPNAPSPVLLAFSFHLKFLTIHPFHDGNGRTARLLSNLILVANGYPPIFVNDDEKAAYNRYLTDIQGYGGEPDLFYLFMAGLLERSLRLMLDMIQSADTDDDWAL